MKDISKEMYILAMQMVATYEQQNKFDLHENSIKNPFVKKNDIIVFTKKSHLNSSIKLGKKYRVVGCNIWFKNDNDSDLFYEEFKSIRNKDVKEYLLENNLQYRIQSLRIDTGLKNNYHLYFNDSYEFYKAN